MIINESNGESATTNRQEPFKWGQEYGITMEGLDYKEDRRVENLEPDREKGKIGDDSIGDSQENEEA